MTQSSGVTATGMSVTVTESSDRHAVGSVLVDADDPVFSGHYPGFPVLPGLYLVDFVDQVAREIIGSGGLRLSDIMSCRFLSPVYPGDHLMIEVATSRSEHGIDTAAVVSAAGDKVAQIKLCYRRKDRA